MTSKDALSFYVKMHRNEAEAKVEKLRKTAAEIGYAVVKADEYNALKRMAASRAAAAKRVPPPRKAPPRKPVDGMA